MWSAFLGFGYFSRAWTTRVLLSGVAMPIYRAKRGSEGEDYPSILVVTFLDFDLIIVVFGYFYVCLMCFVSDYIIGE